MSAEKKLWRVRYYWRSGYGPDCHVVDIEGDSKVTARDAADVACKKHNPMWFANVSTHLTRVTVARVRQ